LSEEKAVEIYGEKNVEVYHRTFQPLEWTIIDPDKNSDECYCKIIVRADSGRVVGIHVFSQDAGEIIQGFAVAIKV
jgi:pyruvate/2-oxoglutarate dehydrogenase complex dihydrolipoamide dehydrogenase (E3) component